MGGVGSAAVQLGQIAGAKVIATAGGPEKTALLKDMGVDLPSTTGKPPISSIW